MSTYLLINLGIIIFPLILSLFPRYRTFYRHWRQLLGSILIVGCVYILWDIIVTSQGHWTFNPSHLLGLNLFHLPIEEWLFFITVPFSCLFLYQALKDYLPNAVIAFNPKLLVSIFVLFCFAGTFIAMPLAYTSFVFGFTALTAILVLLLLPSLFQSKAYLTYSLLGLGLFVIFNSLLTSIPVVIYNSNVILNVRLGTIPLEDFFYNWSLLTLYAFIFDLIGAKYDSEKK